MMQDCSLLCQIAAQEKYTKTIMIKSN